MILDNLYKYSVTLSRCEENLAIRSLKKDEDIPDNLEKFQLSSLLTLLEDGELGNIQPGLYKIISLELSHCNLSELPSGLKFLHLRYLNLSHNKLTVVPSCLYGNGLNKLEHLDLSHNLITHFDLKPDCISSLKVLQLNNNSFENIPPWFLTFNCTSLEELNYSENKAEHYHFLNHSCKFSAMKLSKLELKNACLLDIDILWLRCFRNLQFLDISNKSLLSDRTCINKFKEIDLLFSKPSWTSMKILKLCCLDIAILPENLFWIESLTELHLSNNFLSWFPDGIEHLVNLEYVDVSCNELVMLPKQIIQLTKLKVLIAYKNHLDEIPSIPQNLEVLDLFDNYIQTVEITTFNSIKFIDLDYNFVCLMNQGFDYEEYCLKKDQFRTLYNVKHRCCEYKLPDLQDSSNNSGESSDSDYEYKNCSKSDYEYSDCNLGTNFTLNQQENQEEDWDRECEKNEVYKHPDITLSDNEFDGESGMIFDRESGITFNNFCKQNFLYTDDEELLFIDAD